MCSEHELVNKENMQPNLDKLSEHEPNKRINPYMQPKASASEHGLNKRQRTCLHLVKNSAVDTSVFNGVSFIVFFHFSVITTARVNMPLHQDIIVFNRFSEIQLFPRNCYN